MRENLHISKICSNFAAWKSGAVMLIEILKLYNI